MNKRNLFIIAIVCILSWGCGAGTVVAQQTYEEFWTEQTEEGRVLAGSIFPVMVDGIYCIATGFHAPRPDGITCDFGNELGLNTRKPVK